MIVNRRLGGEFAVAARVNGARVTFLFDTARRRWCSPPPTRGAPGSTSQSHFDVPVTTANGPALAAEAGSTVSVGPIVMRNVRALVARPGALDESLLGMSFSSG